MTNKLVVIINSLKVPKIKKILLYEMKFLVPNYSCLQNLWLGATAPRSPFSVSSVLNWLCWNLPPQKKKIPGYDLAPLRTSEAPCWNQCKEIAYHARWLVGSSELLHGLVGLFPDSSTVPSSRFKASKKNEDAETPFRNVWTAQRWTLEISQVIRRSPQSFQTNARISLN